MAAQSFPYQQSYHQHHHHHIPTAGSAANTALYHKAMSTDSNDLDGLQDDQIEALLRSETEDALLEEVMSEFDEKSNSIANNPVICKEKSRPSQLNASQSSLETSV